MDLYGHITKTDNHVCRGYVPRNSKRFEFDNFALSNEVLSNSDFSFFGGGGWGVGGGGGANPSKSPGLSHRVCRRFIIIITLKNTAHASLVLSSSASVSPLQQLLLSLLPLNASHVSYADCHPRQHQQQDYLPL